MIADLCGSSSSVSLNLVGAGRMEQNKQNDEMMGRAGILLVIIIFGLWFFAREVIFG